MEIILIMTDWDHIPISQKMEKEEDLENFIKKVKEYIKNNYNL